MTDTKHEEGTLHVIDTPVGALTLQQKFVKLREAIPRLSQKEYSDGVKYKFIKIFDIFEVLTPAMNEYGVNFDIVKEVATRHAENGDALFYHSYIQKTKSGERIVWVYEADLTIRWTNADNPADILEVTLHAIGTNDGGPDKAKGSAWTYCLKYYLFEKFGIDQGDDDPDHSDHGSEAPQQGQNRGTAAQNGNTGRNTRQTTQTGRNQTTGAQRKLSDAQLQRMYKIGADAGYTQEQIDERIEQKYGQKDPHNMTREQYDEICNTMAAKAKQGGQENA